MTETQRGITINFTDLRDLPPPLVSGGVREIQ